jgi:hypothetical protein
MIRKTVMMIFGLGLARLGIQLARGLARWEFGESSVWSSRVDALELGFVMGLLGILLWSFVHSKLKEVLGRTRLEDIPYEFNGLEMEGERDRGTPPEARPIREGLEALHTARSLGSGALMETSISVGLGDEVAG